jgi:hypothetical protein
MGAKPFWNDALTSRRSGADVVTMPLADEAPESHGGGARKALVLMLLAGGALALGYVPALDDGSPRRGAFPLPPAASAEAPKAQPAKGRPTEAVASEPVAEAKPPAAAQGQTQPSPPSDPISEEPTTPPVEATPVLQLPVVPQLVEDVNSLVSELPVPVDSVGG